MTFIKSLLKFIGLTIGVAALAIAVTLFAARFADGPWEIIAGGPFTSGETVTEEPDWSFVKDTVTVEFQLLEPAVSRTTWIMEHNGRVFIPCGYMNTTWGRIWKQWPIHVESDNRAILRIDGKMYDRKLVRINDDPDLVAVLAEISRKYAGQPIPLDEVSSGSLWIFEMLPR